MFIVPLLKIELCQEPSALRFKDRGRDTAHTVMPPEDYTINFCYTYITLLWDHQS